MLKIVFWISILIILYTYLGYPLLLLLLSGIKRIFIIPDNRIVRDGFLPDVTLLIAAYNEKDTVIEKMKNSLALDYPSGKLKIVWITDGSDDGTPELLREFSGVHVLHLPERRGKTAAINRAMEGIDTPFVVFSDANTMLLYQYCRYSSKFGRRRLLEI